MSFLVDVMLGISILAVMLGLMFGSYRNCKSYAEYEQARKEVAMQLALGNQVITREELEKYPAVAQKFDERFRGSTSDFTSGSAAPRSDYRVARTQINLSGLKNLNNKNQNESAYYVVTDINGNIIEEAQKSGKGYLWGAIDD